VSDPKAIVDTRVRVPTDIYEQIKAAAVQERRSINAQMIVLFQEALAFRQRKPQDSAQKDD
jgi:hypothetical protein